MHRSGKLRSALVAGWICLALIVCSGAAAPVAVAPDDPTQLLKHADDIKTADNAAFADLLKRLDAESTQLMPTQQMYLRYLKAWQTAYFGDYKTAIPQLNAIIDDSKDVNLRFRAGVTAVNVLGIEKRYEEAYARLSQMLDLLPQVSDPKARQQGIGVAAFLYGQAGQYDLELNYANKLIAEEPQGIGRCTGGSQRIAALYKSGQLQTVGSEFQDGIDTCVKIGEPIWANLIRANAANLEIAQGKSSDAIKLLQPHYDEVQRTHYPEVIGDVDSALAQAYWKSSDAVQAQLYAQRVVDGGIKNEYTEALVGAYRVLYQVAQKNGDYPSAFAYLEKYAAADKGYLNDTSARTLAFQMVKQQVQERKLQVDALNKKNQVLQLQRTVSKKVAEARGLYIVLLLTVLGFIALWAYRTKRSQLRFMKLARRDGLTGIFNRQHFIDAAETVLRYCRKSTRDACVILIDLDHFKLVNDAHGHAAGDLILKRTTSACEAHLRSVDVFGRLGGEEFGILLPDCTAENATQKAEQLRLAIADLSGDEDGVGFPVSASFGVSATRSSGYGLRQLLAHADKALYQAKHEGRNRVVLSKDVTGISDKPVHGKVDRRNT